MYKHIEMLEFRYLNTVVLIAWEWDYSSVGDIWISPTPTSILWIIIMLIDISINPIRNGLC